MASMSRSSQKRPVALRNLAEHKHESNAVRHVAEHVRQGQVQEGSTATFLQSLAADRAAAKLAAEKHKD